VTLLDTRGQEYFEAGTGPLESLLELAQRKRVGDERSGADCAGREQRQRRRKPAAARSDHSNLMDRYRPQRLAGIAVKGGLQDDGAARLDDLEGPRQSVRAAGGIDDDVVALIG
jgi:hypothetical protein